MKLTRYKLVGGPSDGTLISFGEQCIPVNRYLYLNGELYWKTELDHNGHMLLVWEDPDE